MERKGLRSSKLETPCAMRSAPFWAICYVASSDNTLTGVLEEPISPVFKGRLSLNLGEELPLLVK